MDFVFQITNYQDPELESETAELLRQRLEARSRQTVPGLWRATDRLNARTVDDAAAARRRKRCRVYGVLLLVLGIALLVPGLMDGAVNLVWSGVADLGMSAYAFYLSKARRSPVPPASCRKEAAELLELRRETDWETLRAEVRFDGTGWHVTTAEGGSQTPYQRCRGVFETEHLWMLVDEADKALLLQKRDLVQGAPASFLPYVREKLQSQ